MLLKQNDFGKMLLLKNPKIQLLNAKKCCYKYKIFEIEKLFITCCKKQQIFTKCCQKLKNVSEMLLLQKLFFKNVATNRKNCKKKQKNVAMIKTFFKNVATNIKNCKNKRECLKNVAMTKTFLKNVSTNITICKKCCCKRKVFTKCCRKHQICVKCC